MKTMRFKIIEMGDINPSYGWYIFEDTKTGVQYVKFTNCPPIALLNSDGKPYVNVKTEESQHE